MLTHTIEIPTPDGLADGYAIYPGDEEPYPAVIFYMDGIGLRPVLVELAQRIAARGYYVLLPNGFYRAGRAPVFDLEAFFSSETRDEMIGQMRALIGQLTPDCIQRDAGAYLDFLAAQPQVRPGKIATTGYCMGGAVSLRTAAYFPERVAAAASFHGGGLAPDSPQSPHLLAPQMKAELYIGHAQNDASCPAEQIERLETALQSANIRHRSEVYSAGHGWTMPDLPVYNEAEAERAYACLFELLDRNLSAPKAMG